MLFGLIFSVDASAQVVGAILSGSVTDPTGAAIPAAKVTIRNTATGVVTETAANGAGIYSAPNLLPGEYTVSASAPGW